MEKDLLMVDYPDSEESGEAERWSITPLPPAPLKEDEVVEVAYTEGKQTLTCRAVMKQEWTPPTDEGKIKCGTNVWVYFLFDKSRALVSVILSIILGF